MAKIKYDVRDVQSTDLGTPIPTGIYTVEIAEAEQTTSKAGNPMIALTFSINNGEYTGRRLWEYIVLNDNSLWKLKQLTEALGLPARGGIDPDDLISETIQVRIAHEKQPEEFGGGTRARVQAMLPQGEDDEDEDGEDLDNDDDNAGDGGDDDESYVDDYGELSLPDLRAECKERGLKATGPKRVLIQRLEKDDEDADI